MFCSPSEIQLVDMLPSFAGEIENLLTSVYTSKR